MVYVPCLSVSARVAKDTGTDKLRNHSRCRVRLSVSSSGRPATHAVHYPHHRCPVTGARAGRLQFSFPVKPSSIFAVLLTFTAHHSSRQLHSRSILGIARSSFFRFASLSQVFLFPIQFASILSFLFYFRLLASSHATAIKDKPTTIHFFTHDKQHFKPQRTLAIRRCLIPRSIS